MWSKEQVWVSRRGNVATVVESGCDESMDESISSG